MWNSSRTEPEMVAASASSGSGGHVVCAIVSNLGGWSGAFHGGVSCVKDSIIAFTAVADPGYALDRWTGGAGGTIGTDCTVWYESDEIPAGLTAHFAKNVHKFTLDIEGCGWVDADPKAAYFAPGTRIKLEAHPASCGCPDPDGHTCCSSFKYWGAPEDSWASPSTVLTVVMPEYDVGVSAIFSDAAKDGNETGWNDFASSGEICPDSNPETFLVNERKDDCDNRLRLICSKSESSVPGHYKLCYNAYNISKCKYPGGQNIIQYTLCGNEGQRFSQIAHINIDMSDPFNYRGFFKFVIYDCMTCSGRIGEIRHDNDPLPPTTVQDADNRFIYLPLLPILTPCKECLFQL